MNPETLNTEPDSTNVPATRAAFGATEGLWEWTAGGREAWYSSRLAYLLGWSEDDRRGSLDDWLSKLHPADSENLSGALNHCAEHGEPLDISYRMRSPQGEYRWYRTRAARYQQDVEGVVRVSGGVHDIHDQRTAAEESRERERRMMQQQRLQGVDSLAGGVAHEFNNVLQAVAGYVSFAQDELKPGTQPYEDLALALTSLDRAARLTRDLLEFARAESAGETDIDVGEAVRGMLELVSPVIGESIQLDVCTSPGSLVVEADLTELRQSLLNICVNARDAMPAGGDLRVSARPFLVCEANSSLVGMLRSGWYCRIAVTDTGCGIPPDLLRRVFDPFFSTKEAGKGAGMGLAAVYGFAQRSQGHLAVYSDGLEQGTTLSIYLPIKEGTMDVSATKQEQAVTTAKTLLFAEDDTLVREVGKRMLENAGYRVLAYPDGEAALEAFIANVDDIEMVILDVVMPRLGGRQVLEQIRRLQSDVPAILCTGYDPGSVQGDALNYSAQAVLEKPFDSMTLVKTVSDLLQGIETPAAGV